MSVSRLMRQLLAASVLALGAGTASADIVVIDFDDISGIYIDSYSESGFDIVSLETGVGGGHLHPGSGDLWLHSQFGSSPYQIRRTDGANFDVLGFEYLGGTSTFIADNGATFNIVGEVPLTHVELPASFQNVNYINWYMTTPDPDDIYGEDWGRIDNIVTRVAPVPEPAHAGMLGLGLGALLAARRRARRKE
ncbi:PEP-CTERM sorting domain-containing protein [Massilia sp. Dwa41.01b]|uniref:PEP-CTERM sorting domain-containing protein n=1 Tax=unclassified Massilia TaxID=2609279 RepID=UPI001602D4B2|nr:MULTISPECIES: PEP-CTERM sorting domain-containing protein [unclassified Massilia]QNA87891.1 PEP-CTERM sorting domain-containing protein [Massilia sp. Dwa41.01b]QNA98795.1 PEP-CTERM sorting domain-containing protein [Massilia sp. Se16.2.3]